MEEKYMVNDILYNLKSDIKNLQNSILNCTNTELRQTLQNIRNSEENFQYELYKLSESKGYSTISLNASADEIDSIKNDIM